MLNQRGSILIAAYIILLSLLAFGGIFFSRSVSDRKLLDINRERQEAFYLAETAVDKGLEELRDNYSYAGSASPVAFARGEYEIVVTSLSSSRRKVMAYGYVPDKAQARARRVIEAITKRDSPPNFFDHAIYSANDIDFNGGSYAVNGDVIYADTVDNPGNVTGTVTQDSEISPLAQFDFAALRDIAISQGNLYDVARLDLVKNKQDSYPADFWNVPPTGDPIDPATGTPNVVYVEGDMVLNGDIGTIGGFFLVVGDVVTNPDSTSDTTINGNGEVDGCIYTTGDFRINGGGGGLNVNGGVWAGNEARLNGNATITYGQDFMDAIKSMIESQGLSSKAQILTWREIE
ncbi:MAG TPA: hypothetical protein DCL35_08645 [Candidatus Omnitrophica bacterium]|nr:hypothetical protein [Candidatus Omnitrophota bacterium]